MPVTPSYQGTQPIITSHALSQSSAGFKIWLMQCMKVLPQGTALIHHRLMLRSKYKVHILVTDINVDFIQNWNTGKGLCYNSSTSGLMLGQVFPLSSCTRTQAPGNSPLAVHAASSGLFDSSGWSAPPVLNIASSWPSPSGFSYRGQPVFS